jgi:hypothetical protein
LLPHPDDAAIVGSTVGLSRRSGLSVVAEGIDSRSTADLLLRWDARKAKAVSPIARCGRFPPKAKISRAFLLLVLFYAALVWLGGIHPGSAAAKLF